MAWNPAWSWIKDFGIKPLQLSRLKIILRKNQGIDLSKVFDQYLRDTKIPLLQYKIEGNKVSYKYDRVVAGLRCRFINVNGKEVALIPNETLQTFTNTDEVKLWSESKFYVDSEVWNNHKSLKKKFR